MLYNNRRMARAEAELEQLLARVDAAVAETESAHRPRRMVLKICQRSSQRANQLRRAMQQARSLPDSQRPEHEIRRLRLQANHFVRRWANQALRYIPKLHPYDIDYLIGCLARLEHAVGSTLPALRPLRSAARQRLRRI